MPTTTAGKWSLGLIVALPILLFIASSLSNSLYASVSAGNSIVADIAARPLLALTMLVGILSGILAFAAGLIAIFRFKERALFVYIATCIGTFLLLFLVGEAISPETKNSQHVCPEAWYDNQMPRIVGDTSAIANTEDQYFIIDGKRVELGELDVNWVKLNCTVNQPQAVQ